MYSDYRKGSRMGKLKIEYMNVNDLIPYINNPRKNDDAVGKVASSIKNFGFKVPIIVDKGNEIIAGHTRLKAAKKLGLEEVPVIKAEDLNEAQVKAFRIADNKVTEYSEWDEELLKIELEGIEGFTGFDNKEIKKLLDDAEDVEDLYVDKAQTPQYEITGECPDIDELVDDRKTNYLIENIEKADLSEEQKDFLIKAAQRHLVFNYSKIAEYYAHADMEMQELMEESALVIIDYDNAIENGYVELSKTIQELMGEADAE